MKALTPELKAGFLSGKIASLIKLTLKDGTVHGFTDHDFPITVDATLYQPAPGLSKLRMYCTNNAEVSNQEFASPWLDAPEADLKAGLYDNAKIDVQWTYWEDPSLGALNIFSGHLGSIQWSEDGFKADIQNYLKDLARNVGTIVTGQCRHKLYSPVLQSTIGGCGLTKGDYATTGAVTLILTNKVKFKVDVTNPDKYFTNGIVEFTSGQNIGKSYEIKIHEVHTDANIGTSFELFLPAQALVQVGDLFTVYAGCDKSVATCKAKFNNVINFGGFPHIQPGVNFR